MKNKKAIIFTFITILWTGFIFFNSFMNGTASTKESNFVLEIVYKILGEGSISPALLRKAAHFTEYFILGTLLLKTVWEYKHMIFKVITVPLFFGLFTAVCDETIQLFSEGRSGQVSDILIDFSGVVAGIIITGLIVKK